jgi:ubiquitin-conjugating enzyme E2 D/E
VKNPNADNLGLILSSLPLRMQHELQAIMMEPVDGCIAAPKDESNLFEWSSTIKGPEKSPYAGGTFLMDIRFPEDYPFKAPKVRFRTRIYHCNISRKGEVCIDILKTNWSAAITITQLLLSICALLVDCNPADPLEADIAQHYLRDRHAHDKVAQEWTRKYAIQDA